MPPRKRKLQTQSESAIVAENNTIESTVELPNSLPLKVTELLYLNKKGADVIFTFKSSAGQVTAHKLILAMLSPVFDVAFFGSMPEKDKVKIDDDGINADTFKQFLQFFYTKKVKLSLEHIRGVLHLGKKYQIEECLEICSTFLKENLTIDEMCMGYQLALHYDQTDLKKFCEREISMNAEAVLKSEGFLNCDHNVLIEIVKIEKLLCRESVLLEACVNWGRNSCKRNKINADDKENIRSQLKDVIYKIRFKGISLNEFSKFFINSQNPYNDDELKDIHRIMEGEKTIMNKFNDSYRIDSLSWNGSARISCKRWVDVACEEHNVPNIISTIFSSDKTLVLGAFGLYFRPFDQNICCVTSVERVDFETNIIKQFNTKQISTKPKNGKYISFLKPVIIQKNIKYKIITDFTSNNIQFKSFNKLEPEVKLDNGAVITFHRDASTDFDNIEKGVITWLYFNEFCF